ncbi:MAG: hypothetical protein LBN99_01155 [Oscillospiraceae bacterium]|jgi:hypothetical protein|nr:hypothetical protein [Oscillospiraceae bacterium]
MELIAIILTDILYLALIAFAVTLDRRIARLEARARRGDAPNVALSEKSEAEERRFSEAIASIMGYALPPDEEEGCAK